MTEVYCVHTKKQIGAVELHSYSSRPRFNNLKFNWSVTLSSILTGPLQLLGYGDFHLPKKFPYKYTFCVPLRLGLLLWTESVTKHGGGCEGQLRLWQEHLFHLCITRDKVGCRQPEYQSRAWYPVIHKLIPICHRSGKHVSIMGADLRVKITTEQCWLRGKKKTSQEWNCAVAQLRNSWQLLSLLAAENSSGKHLKILLFTVPSPQISVLPAWPKAWASALQNTEQSTASQRAGAEIRAPCASSFSSKMPRTPSTQWPSKSQSVK